jgi:hypothetical protein
MTWLMSALTIYAMWQAGNKSRLGWIVGLLNQVLWAAYIFDRREFGLIPMNVAMCLVYARNLRKWSYEQRTDHELQNLSEAQ